jgi:hypothetical protein
MLIAFMPVPCHATEFIVVQIPHGWVIGADSMVTGPFDAPINKICYVEDFILLRFGPDAKGGDPSFNLDEALSAAVKGKKTQYEAVEAATHVLMTVYEKQLEIHNQRPQWTNEEYLKRFSGGFVLLGLLDGRPMIDVKELNPDSTLTKIEDGSSQFRESLIKAHTLDTPAPFSIHYLPPTNPERVKADPEKTVYDLLIEMAEFPGVKGAVGPPYNVVTWDGKTIKSYVPAGHQ